MLKSSNDMKFIDGNQQIPKDWETIQVDMTDDMLLIIDNTL